VEFDVEFRDGYGPADVEMVVAGVPTAEGLRLRARYPGGNSPFPRKWTNGNELPAIRSNPHSYRVQLPRMANSPF
jgi:hypothetical protein